MNYKICTKCGKELPATLDYFCKKKTGKLGLNSYCKFCANRKHKEWSNKNKDKIQDYQREYYKNNKENKLKYQKKYREDNIEKVKKSKKTYYENNREYVKNKVKKYRNKNKEKISAKYKIWADKNKEKINLYNRNKYKNDIDFKIKHNLRTSLNRLISGKNKNTSVLKLLGCTFQEFKDHLKSLFEVGMTWNNYGEWHVDHILPCASFELKYSEEQEICFAWWNFQPLWAKDNLRKSNKII